MKTAISLPDKLFEQAEQTAKTLGLARSKLFAKALEEFIQNHAQETITTRINNAVEKIGNSERFDDSVNIATMRNLLKNDTW